MSNKQIKLDYDDDMGGNFVRQTCIPNVLQRYPEQNADEITKNITSMWYSMSLNRKK